MWTRRTGPYAQKLRYPSDLTDEDGDWSNG